MRQTLTAVGIFFILTGVFGLSYSWNYDHRTAKFLDEYAVLDFQTSLNGDARLEGAVLSLWDYRFDNAKFLPKAVLYTDGDPWEMVASVKQQKAMSNRIPRMWQMENKLFMEFPRSSLPAILMSRVVRLKIYYDNGQTINLPVSDEVLKDWKRKMR